MRKLIVTFVLLWFAGHAIPAMAATDDNQSDQRSNDQGECHKKKDTPTS